MSDFRIRLVKYYAGQPDPFILGRFLFSSGLAERECDALLCLAPDESLFSFKGPRALYWQEARANLALFHRSLFRRYVRLAASGQFLSHWNPDRRFYVPHVTHWDTLAINKNPGREDKGIAVVSNRGSSMRRLLGTHRATDLRTRFATHSRVDLYGKEAIWRRFPRGLFAIPGCPGNYRGEVPGTWGPGAKLELASKYKVMICMENTVEPWYFTEKFVDAVRAGCVPIYNAHETVRNGILQGAKWVDPGDFQFNVDHTLELALGERIEEYWAANEAWLGSAPVAETNYYSVFRRIGEILSAHTAEK